jgi:hypothetical protein
VRGGVGGGEELAHEHQELKARPGVAWEEEGVTGGGMPMAAEVAARRGSSARGFPVRKATKFWSSSCSRRRESYWGGWIGWRRGGGMVSTGIEAHRRGGSDGEVVPVGVQPRGVAWEC